MPIHVVQRYIGHLTPEMTMRYAQTLAETAEAEFLRFRKLTADARPVQADPGDLYDMLQLTAAPTGYCPTGGACCRHGSPVTAGTLA